MHQSAVEFLATATRDLNASLDLPEVLRTVAERACEFVPCDLLCVMLYDEESRLLHHSYSLKLGEHVEQTGSFPIGYGISGTAAQLKQPIRVADVRQDARYVRFRHADVEIRSELAIPLLIRDRVIGVLDLESLEPDGYSLDHEQMLTTLASHLAMALENARLYQRVSAQEQRMEREIATARKIQKGLMPRNVPLMDGFEVGKAFRPARELAGDFYDFLLYADGRLALTVADVAGKATPAALYGSLAVGLMRGHVVQQQGNPSQMLQHLNDQLVALTVEGRFLAMVYALVDPRERTLTLASAGFPFPRLVRKGEVTVLDSFGDIPLGLFAKRHYEDFTLVLQPGDLVVFVSDGLEDGLDPKGNPSMGERLNTWLARLSPYSAQEVVDELMQASTPALTGRSESQDDRTAVAIRVK